jgi:hypothetical protein
LPVQRVNNGRGGFLSSLYYRLLLTKKGVNAKMEPTQFDLGPGRKNSQLKIPRNPEQCGKFGIV